eukprot:120804_1
MEICAACVKDANSDARHLLCHLNGVFIAIRLNCEGIFVYWVVLNIDEPLLFLAVAPYRDLPLLFVVFNSNNRTDFERSHIGCQFESLAISYGIAIAIPFVIVTSAGIEEFLVAHSKH